MTLNSVVLPAPLGPMIPRSSPALTSIVTSRTAVSPPNRLVTPCSLSIAVSGSLRYSSGHPGQPFRNEADNEDQDRAVDDKIDAGEAGLTGEGSAQVRLHGGDEDRAQVGAQGRAHAPDDGVEREAYGQIYREDVERIDEAHVLRPQRSSYRGEGGAQRDREDLQPAGRDTQRLGRILVLTDTGQLVADPGALEVELDEVIHDGQGQREIDPGHVAEAECPESRPEGHGNAFRTGRESPPAAGHDQEHLREGDRRQREVGAAEAVREIPN